MLIGSCRRKMFAQLHMLSSDHNRTGVGCHVVSKYRAETFRYHVESSTPNRAAVCQMANNVIDFDTEVIGWR